MERCLVTDIQVEILAKGRVVLIGIDVLAPTVQELVQVVEIVLLPAVTTMGSSSCICINHSPEPAVVMTNGGEKVAIIFVKQLREEHGASTDIEINVHAITIWSTNAFVAGELHQTLLTSSTNGARYTRTLLHGKRRKENSRDSILATILLKCCDKVLAVCECRIVLVRDR